MGPSVHRVYVALVQLVVCTLFAIGATRAEPWSFRHLGDPQIGMTEPLRAQNGNYGWEFDVQRFKKAAEMANAGRAAHVVVAGDLTDKWENQTFADGFLSVYPIEFQQKVSLIPGNHDMNNEASAEDFLAQREHYRATFSEKDYSYEVVNNAFFLSVNTPVLIHKEPNKALTNEAEAQWRFIEESLQKANAMEEIDHIFIVMHHPPFIEDEFEFAPEGSQLPEAANYWPPAPRERFLALVRKYGVRNLLCGHTHTTEVMRPADLAFTIYTVAGTARHWDNNGYGFRIFDVDGPFLTQRYEQFDLE